MCKCKCELLSYVVIEAQSSWKDATPVSRGCPGSQYSDDISDKNAKNTLSDAVSEIKSVVLNTPIPEQSVLHTHEDADNIMSHRPDPSDQTKCLVCRRLYPMYTCPSSPELKACSSLYSVHASATIRDRKCASSLEEILARLALW